MKLMCHTEVATSKFVIEAQSNNGTYPQTEVLNDFVESKESFYEVAKSLINPKGLINMAKNPFVKAQIEKIGPNQGYWEALAYRPSEMLGHIEDGKMVDEILEAYQDTIENYYNRDEKKETIGFRTAVNRIMQWDSKEGAFKDSSEFADYNDAIYDLMDNDPNTYNYFKNWMNFLHERPKVDDWGSRVREALLKQSVSGAILNSTQLAVTVAPNANPKDLLKGIELFLNDRQDGYKELKSLGIGERSHLEEVKGKEGFDIFKLPEKYNQGIAYYIGKSEALRKNPALIEEQAQQAGIKFNEKTNFIPRPGNVPRAYWNEKGRSALTLMSYSIQYNKMYWGAWKNLAMTKGERGKSAGFLASHIIIGTLLFGVDSVIPAPIFALLGDDDKKELVNLSKYSLVQGLLRFNFSSQLRPGEIGKFIPVNFSVLENFQESFQKVAKEFNDARLDEDYEELAEPKTLTKFAKLGRAGLIVGPMLNPKIAKLVGFTKFGGGQLGELLETATRIGSGNYERMDWDTKKKYKTSPQEELLRIVGKPRSEKEKAYGLQ